MAWYENKQICMYISTSYPKLNLTSNLNDIWLTSFSYSDVLQRQSGPYILSVEKTFSHIKISQVETTIR